MSEKPDTEKTVTELTKQALAGALKTDTKRRSRTKLKMVDVPIMSDQVPTPATDSSADASAGEDAAPSLEGEAGASEDDARAEAAANIVEFPNQIGTTEAALNDAFRTKYRDDYRYMIGIKQWLRHLPASGTWENVSTEIALSKMKRLCRKAAKQAGGQAKFNGELTRLESLGFAKRSLEYASGETPFMTVVNDWNTDDYLLGTPGGIIDLRTGSYVSVGKGKRAPLISMRTSVPPADNIEFEMWLRFLTEATAINGIPDEEMLEFLRVYIGYCLTGDTSLRQMMFVHGPTTTGKNVFMDTLIAIFGDYTANATMEAFSLGDADRHTTDIAMLNGPRLITASETKDNQQFDEQRIKQLTGDKTVTARKLYCDNVQFRPKGKILLIGNSEPSLKNIGGAMRSRLNVLGFNNHPKEIVTNLAERMEHERPAILRWFISGTKTWLDGGRKMIIAPRAIQERTDAYFADQDRVQHWLDQNCSVTNPEHFTDMAFLFIDYERFCKDHGDKAGNSRSLKRKLKEKGFVEDRTKTARGMRGIRLNNRFVPIGGH